MRGPPGADLAAIEAEVIAGHGWLLDLDRGQELIDVAALRVAWARVAAQAVDRASELPDPAATIISSEKDARRRARQRWNERAEPALQALRALPAVVAVGDLTPLLSAEFHTGHDAIERAGRQAMIQAITQCSGQVRLHVRRGRLRARVELDGARLALRRGRIPLDAFFETTSVPLLAIQRAYHDGRARHARAELARRTDENAWLAAALLGAQIAEQRQEEAGDFLAEARRGSDDSPEATELRDMARERRDVAEQSRTTVVAAMAPLIVVAGFFAIEGAADVFLALFPFGKAGKLIKGLARRGKTAATLSKARRGKIAAALGDNERHFMELVGTLGQAGKLGRAEMRALGAIAEKAGKPEVVNLLLVQAAKGQADLSWIARKLDDGAFDHGFIEHFMRYDANPTWAQLRGLLDNQLDTEARASAVSKLLGFLGEEAGARHVQSEVFSRRFFPRGETTSVTRGHEALDLIVTGGDKGQMVVGEVKNWSVETWQDSSQLDRLFKQLGTHNKTVEKVAKKANDREVVGRVLLVTERGFMKLGAGQRKDIKDRVDILGWSIEVIPGKKLESMTQFIDRMRDGGS